VGRSVHRLIPSPVVSAQGTVIRRCQPYLYFSPLRRSCGRGTIAEHVLISHGAANCGGSFRNLSSAIDGNRTTAGHVSNFTQPHFSQFFFDAVKEKCLKQADGINLHVGFLCHTLYLSELESACIVASVGQNENGLALIPCGSQFGDCQVYSIQHRRGSSWLLCQQLPLELIDRLGRISQYPRTIRKCDREILIITVCIVEKFNNCCPLGLDLVTHTLTDVQKYSDGNRIILG